jgi:bifunctional non-homologous end joining protein LigD
MPTETMTENITLYYRDGSSDKVYSASIEPKGTGFVVNFAYGRRGSTMNTGTKTELPVEYAAAKKIFDKLIKEKTAKGYTPGESGTPYQQTDNADRATGIVSQLLNPIEEHEAGALINDGDWWAQEKLDGKRVLIRKVAEEIIGINRRGLVIALPEPIADLARRMGSQQWIIDGEAIGNMFFAFDLLESACVNRRELPYSKRIKILEAIVPADAMGPIRFVPLAKTKVAKAGLLGQLRGAKAEGIVFKRHDAPYTPGRPASGGAQVKMKFTAAASCLVAGTNGTKRSVKLELIDGGKRVGVGNVTIPANQKIPLAGRIVEIRYLYAFQGGSLYQPVYLGERDDIALDACTVRQLKFKAGESDDN